jgi:hypothetical protein
MRGTYIFTLLVAGLMPVAAMAAPDKGHLTGVASPAVMGVRVSDAHVAPADAGASVAIAMVLTNPGKATVTLTGAASPLAGQTLLRQYVKGADGLYQLRTLEQVDVPPQFDLVLAPGGLELQLVGLTQPLEAGLEIPVTLKFNDGSQRTVRVAVTMESIDRDNPAAHY